MISLLYVDDEPALLDLCRLFLEREGDISVVTVSSAGEAFTRIAAGKFDAIISDYQMPEVDGISFLRRIREMYPDMPFLLFTGRGREEVVIDAINNGADSYIQKGGDPRSQFKELSHLVRQIVRRRKAETELRLMKFSVDHASEGILWMRPDGSISYYNDAVCAMLGYEPDEFAGLTVSDIRPGMSRNNPYSAWGDLPDKKSAIIEEILVKKDHSFLPVELVLNYTGQGPESLVFAFVRDISERRRSERELKNAIHQLMSTEDGLQRQIEEIKKSDDVIRAIGQRYQLLSEETDSWVWECTLDGRFTNSNPQVEEILGFGQGDLIGKTFGDLLSTEGTPDAERDLIATLVKKEAFRSHSLSMKHRNGSTCLVELTGTPLLSQDGAVTGFFGIARPVSCELNSPDARGGHVQSYGSLLEKFNDAIFVADGQTGMLIDANQKALALTGRTLAEILSLKESALFVDGDRNRTESENSPGTDPVTGVYESAILTRSGTLVPVIVCTRMVDLGGRHLRIGICHDISDIRAISSSLQEKNGELDRFFQTGPDLLCVMDARGRFLRLNPAGEMLVGREIPDQGALSMDDIIHQDDRAATRSILRNLGRREKAITFTNRVILPDGSCRWIEWRASLSGRKLVYAAARDQTERKKIERAVALANRKLNLLTDITRHNIRNKLVVLTGYFDMFRDHPGEPYFSMYLEKIADTVLEISEQVEHTSLFQSLGMAAPLWVDTHDLFTQVCEKHEIPSGYVQSTPDKFEIFADPLIERVFSILADNAMVHGTTLTEIRRSSLETPDGLVVVIEDNGIGIPQGDKEKIFEKDWGKSSGHFHSLFLAREILSITGISIRETGKAGKGSRFELLVPRGMYQVSEPKDAKRAVLSPDFINHPNHNHTI